MRNILLLIVIILLGATLRFWGLGYDLPNVYNLDEHEIMDTAVGVADGYLQHETILRGSLPNYTIGAAIKLASLINPNLQGDDKTLTESYLQDKTGFYIIGRSLNAFWGVIEIVLIYSIGFLLFNVSIALLASFFLSISPLAIQSAHAVSPDTALSATMLLTIAIAIFAYKRKKSGLFLLAGFLSGLAGGQKFPGILTLPLVIIVLIYYEHTRNRKILDIAWNVILIILSSLIAYILSYPYVFRDFGKLIAEWQFENSTVLYWDRPPHVNFGILWRLEQSAWWLRMWNGTFLFYLSIVGLLLNIKTKNVLARIIGIFWLFFFFINAEPIKMHEFRYIPLIPFINMFAAYVCSYVHRQYHSRQKPFHAYGSTAIIALLSITPFLKSVFLANAYASPSTQSLELAWVAKNSIDEKTILRDPFTNDESNFTLDWITPRFSPKRPWHIHTKSIQMLGDYTYAIVNDEFASWYFFWKRYIQSLRSVSDTYRYIDQSSVKTAEFLPRDIGYNQEDLDFLLHANRWTFHQIRGPKIIIYKLNK